jgi:transcriptional regulator with XRE-family HTH domain
MDAGDLKRLFGRKVQALREQRGLTQEQLAERIERTVDTVGNIERGANSTRLETVARIADVLGLELAELFELDEADLAGRARRRQAANLARELAEQDDETFDTIRQMVELALRLRSPSR